MPKNCIRAIRQKKYMPRKQLAALVDLQPKHIALFDKLAPPQCQTDAI
ncbi:hypothetical protein [Hyphomicrobium sp. 1Nfss2.1]